MTSLLDNRIHALTTRQLWALVRRLAAEPDVWLPRVQVPDSGKRRWTQLSRGPDADVWLLSWLPGHATELHDHGPSAAAFTVVHGVLSEVRIAPDGRQISRLRRAGSTTTLGVGVIHDVRGAGRGPAVSIHAYSPPLVRMTYYEPDPHRRLRVRSTLDTREPELEANG